MPLSGTDDPAYIEFVEDFNAPLVAENDALKSQVTTLTTERDNALAQVTPLQDENSALKAELDALKNPPFDPRVIHPFAFLQRYTLDERVAILTAAKTDVQVELMLAELQTVTRVRLDEVATQNGVDYLIANGVIVSTRKPTILADATAGEAP